MLEIYPKLTSAFIRCPACGCQLTTPSGLKFYGEHVLADVLCSCCDVEYFHSYPAKDKSDPSSFAFTKNQKSMVYASNSAKWKALLLARAAMSEQDLGINIKIEKNTPGSEVVLYNLLYDSEKDVSTALGQLKEKKDGGKIFLILLKHRHLLKSDVSEVWTLEGNSGLKHLPALNSFLQDQLPRFDKVYLGQIETKLISKINWWTKLGLFLKL